MIEENKINIMDFERGIANSIKNYFLNTVYEEYGAFLLPKERIYQMEDIFTTEASSLINIKEISSKRVRTILDLMGYKEYAPFSKFVLAVKMIVINEEPYQEEEGIIFPLIELDEYMQKKVIKNIVKG